MQFSEFFLREHELIRRAVAVLEVMTERAKRGIFTDRHDVNALLIFLHYFVDACHQTKEESVLFPALREAQMRAQSDLSAEVLLRHVENLLREHTEDRSLIEKSQLALFSDKFAEFIENSSTLANLLSRHAFLEEHYLFPAAEKMLSRQEADNVMMRIEEADSQFGTSQRKLLIEMLEQLERKYVARAA